jgi:cohesin complex subunit SA-1/2
MSSDDVAGQFLESYQEDKYAAVTELVNFMLKSAGCDLQVNEDEIQDTDNVVRRLSELQDEYQAVSSLTIMENTAKTVV